MKYSLNEQRGVSLADCIDLIKEDHSEKGV